MSRLQLATFCLCSAICFVLLSGCWTKPPSKSAANSTSDAKPIGAERRPATDRANREAEPPPPESSPDDEPIDQGKEDRRHESSDDTKGEPLSDKTADSKTGQSLSDSFPSTPERILILGKGGPVIMDVTIMIDGSSHVAAANALIDDILRLADTDTNGQTSWKEITRSPLFIYGQFGNPRVENEQQRLELVKTYDIDQDEQVDRSEVLGFLRQDAAQPRPYRLVDSPTDQLANQTGLFQWVDVDHDYTLSSVEIERLPHRLWLNDIQDDGILVADDFRTELNPATVRRRTRPGVRRAIHLGDNANWSRILYLLEERYSYGNPMSQPDWIDVPLLFEQIDTDEDGFLRPDEFARILETTADIWLKIWFEKTDLKYRFELGDGHAEVNVIRASQQGMRFSANGTQIEILMMGGRALFEVDRQSERMFKLADANKDSYLTEDEYAELEPELNVPFAAVDSDKNKKAFKTELTHLLKRRSEAQGNRIRSTVSDPSDTAFAFIDLDDDGQLTYGEVSSSAERIAKLDENSDGLVTLSEFPAPIIVQFNRGIAEPAFDRVAEHSPTAVSWFDGMDSNRDGHINFKEFLGNASDFAKLDKNQDGSIDKSEAQHVD